MTKTIVYVKYTDDNHEYITVKDGFDVFVEDGILEFVDEEDSATVRIALCNTFRVDVYEEEEEEEE